ncbi:hypothetical protein AQPE_1709 [Aquipluma nitroreducens]|uniref:Uncharacterized protein n=1 Tax=Aquipluma nitroreducens TaxID=2010828 RepID=A0A5K7S7M0_9BACT|nr:hypothetical protein AQPE_1709 [Aquipluma nitroreducens]
MQCIVFVPPKEKKREENDEVSVKKISLFDDQREEFGNFQRNVFVFSFLSLSGGSFWLLFPAEGKK